ncbi:arylamine N-acetyltransferase family protein [Pleomorphovibrio marinus]|uniref:arylamine N-acetyltransferase family protein n=1 Tax=Pleomorphovibrio marinus TaxID=2164132 RepID=UPI000E0A791F|nr:arylamine N-acetyltransferase [Pleomorphovibrio marinus]
MNTSSFKAQTPAKNSPFYTPLSKEQLSAYFRKIGFEDEPACSLDCLQALHYRHTLSIPFENFNPLLRIPLALEQDALVQKIVYQQRGGYCFEHNLLFGAVLRTLGFEVTGLAARVMWQIPEDVVMPRDHQLLLVNFGEEPYIADVGFGGNTLTAPLPLQSQEAHSTSHEDFKISHNGSLYVLHIKLEENWKPMYSFGLDEYLLPDYQVMSYYLCNHEKSLFMNHLFLAQTKEDGRYGLMDDHFSFHPVNGKTQKERIQNMEHLLVRIRDVFGIDIPAEDSLKAWLTNKFEDGK